MTKKNVSMEKKDIAKSFWKDTNPGEKEIIFIFGAALGAIIMLAFVSIAPIAPINQTSDMFAINISNSMVQWAYKENCNYYQVQEWKGNPNNSSIVCEPPTPIEEVTLIPVNDYNTTNAMIINFTFPKVTLPSYNSSNLCFCKSLHNCSNCDVVITKPNQTPAIWHSVPLTNNLLQEPSLKLPSPIKCVVVPNNISNGGITCDNNGICTVDNLVRYKCIAVNGSILTLPICKDCVGGGYFNSSGTVYPSDFLDLTCQELHDAVVSHYINATRTSLVNWATLEYEHANFYLQIYFKKC